MSAKARAIYRSARIENRSVQLWDVFNDRLTKAMITCFNKDVAIAPLPTSCESNSSIASRSFSSILSVGSNFSMIGSRRSRKEADRLAEARVEKNAYLDNLRLPVGCCYPKQTLVTFPAIAVDQLQWTAISLDLNRKRSVWRLDDRVDAAPAAFSAPLVDRDASHAAEGVVQCWRVDHPHLRAMAFRNENFSERDNVDVERPQQVV